MSKWQSYRPLEGIWQGFTKSGGIGSPMEESCKFSSAIATGKL